jgi:UDP-N-acetylglucosamine acyltransferase
MARIHPTAVVSADAQLGEDVDVGPYAIIDGPVRLGAGTVVLAHSQILGKTTVGRNGRIGPAAYVGMSPQHIGADPDAGSLIVGDDVHIRETASLHRASTAGDDHATRIGDRAFIMAAVHVGHDSVVGAEVVLAHGMMLGGHCRIGPRAFLGGGSAVHQFCRVGRLAMVRGNEAITQDVPPFAAALYGGLKGYNAVGCKRAGLSRAAIHALRSAYRLLLGRRVMGLAIDDIRREGLADVPEVAEVVAFVLSAKRGIVPSLRFARARGGGGEDGE